MSEDYHSGYCGGYGGVDGESEGAGAAFQVIVLGGGGGPNENDTTGLLVRSTSTQWAKGSLLAVDAGVHLAALIEILRDHLPGATRVTPPRAGPGRWNRMGSPVPIGGDRGSRHRQDGAGSSYFAPISESRGSRAGSPTPIRETANQSRGKLVLRSGPFADLMLPYDSARANAAYLLRNLISAFLITHPHLDHLAGFAVNTAAFQHTTRPKKLAALPSTIDAVKSHIFNDVIWPNLSDEEGGAGLVSYQRLVEGGHGVLGDGEGRGYIEVCDGLAVKAWSVSHGHCMKRHSHRGSNCHEHAAPYINDRRASRVSNPMSPHSVHGSVSVPSMEFSQSPQHMGGPCVIDSSAYFIRDDETGQEILIFGDVEPDSLSLSPRTARVWADAAPKIVAGVLSTIFIECSYDDSQPDETLFGHLAPRHLITELAVLANKVANARSAASVDTEARTPTVTLNDRAASDQTRAATSGSSERKRKRALPDSEAPPDADRHDAKDDGYGLASSWPLRKNNHARPSLRRSSRPSPRRTVSSISPISTVADVRRARSRERQPSPSDSGVFTVDGREPHLNGDGSINGNINGNGLGPLFGDSGADLDGAGPSAVDGEEGAAGHKDRPLRGLRVVVIHVKDSLSDGPEQRDVVLAQLRDREATLALGCTFVRCARGDSIWA